MVNQIALRRLRHNRITLPGLRLKVLLAPVLVAAMLVAGCATQAGTAVLAYERNNITLPPLTTVESVGLYALFPGDGITPLDAVYLTRGDKFGFRSRDGKTVGAYIKSGEAREVPLDGVLTSEYIWRYQGDKKP